MSHKGRSNFVFKSEVLAGASKELYMSGMVCIYFLLVRPSSLINLNCFIIRLIYKSNSPIIKFNAL